MPSLAEVRNEDCIFETAKDDDEVMKIGRFEHFAGGECICVQFKAFKNSHSIEETWVSL